MAIPGQGPGGLVIGQAQNAQDITPQSKKYSQSVAGLPRDEWEWELGWEGVPVIRYAQNAPNFTSQ